jgi:transcriptional regulator with XRE-family HTH domain
MTGLQNSRDPARAEYDTREFARAIRLKLNQSKLGYRAIAERIGVTPTDIARASGGQNISTGRVIALCKWLGVPVERFYLEPDLPKRKCFTGSNVKHPAPPGHGARS